MTSTRLVRYILRSTAFVVALSSVVPNASAEGFNPAPLTFPCGVGANPTPCPTAGIGSSTSAATAIGTLAPAVVMAVAVLGPLMHRSHRPDPRVATNRDKVLPQEDIQGIYAWHFPDDGLIPGSLAYEFATPEASMGSDCTLARARYYTGHDVPDVPGCVSRLDYLTTYHPTGGVLSYTSPAQPEVVIDGSNIPSVIDFTGADSLDSVTAATRRPARTSHQRNFDGTEIPSRIDFPCTVAPVDPSLSLFTMASNKLHEVACRQGLGR